MTDMLTRFDIALHNRVDQLQDRLQHIRESAVPTGSDLDVRLELLAERLDSSRDRAVTAKHTLEDWVDVQIEELRDWRDERHVDKLMKQSRESQRLAQAALDVALNALDEAEMALTKAAIAQDSAEDLAPERFSTDVEPGL